MTLVPWGALALFMIAVELLALYGLTVSGHFPAEFRAAELRTGIGATIMWATLVAACLAAAVVLSIVLRVLPWSAIVIGAGAMLLAAPLLLRPLPDRFVNGPGGLIGLSAGAVAAAFILWIMA
jgi:hypothetical protein